MPRSAARTACLHWGTLAVAAPFVAAALLGAAPAARANCYSFTNVSGAERYLNFSYNHPIAGAPAYVKLEPNDRYPSSGHPYCVDDPETRIEVYLGAGGAIVGWDGAQVIGNGSTLGFMMGDDSIATPGGDYKID